MNVFGRSRVVSSLRVLFSNQPALLLSCLKHPVEPLCSVFIHKQVTQLPCTTMQQRYQHTLSSFDLENMSAWQRLKWKVGFHGKMQVSKLRLTQAGYNLYICCTDLIDFGEFVKVLNIPDTFNSWFLLLQLHLWMVNVKVSQMGREGAILKTSIYQAMWSNVEKRLGKFKDLSSKEKREALNNYHSLMCLSILYYDEGLLGSDKLLANSLWVQLFAMNPSVEADKLELMVKYVRKQVYHHDRLDPYPIMNPGYISFLPLLDDQLDEKKALHDLHYLTDTQQK